MAWEDYFGDSSSDYPYDWAGSVYDTSPTSDYPYDWAGSVYDPGSVGTPNTGNTSWLGNLAGGVSNFLGTDTGKSLLGLAGTAGTSYLAGQANKDVGDTDTSWNVLNDAQKNALSEIIKASQGTTTTDTTGTTTQQSTGTTTQDQQQQQIMNWLAGTPELAAMLQQRLTGLSAPQQAVSPEQMSYYGQATGNLMGGLDPNSIASMLALQQATVQPSYYYPGQQWGQAQSALTEAQNLAKYQFPQQIEQLTGWNRGTGGLANQQESMAVANLLAQLSQQQQALSTQQAASQQQAAGQATAAQQWGIPQYAQQAPTSLQNIMSSLGVLGYPQQAQQAEQQRQASYLQALQSLLGTQMQYPQNIQSLLSGTSTQQQAGTSTQQQVSKQVQDLLSTELQNLTSRDITTQAGGKNVQQGQPNPYLSALANMIGAFTTNITKP